MRCDLADLVKVALGHTDVPHFLKVNMPVVFSGDDQGQRVHGPLEQGLLGSKTRPQMVNSGWSTPREFLGHNHNQFSITDIAVTLWRALHPGVGRHSRGPPPGKDMFVTLPWGLRYAHHFGDLHTCTGMFLHLSCVLLQAHLHQLQHVQLLHAILCRPIWPRPSY